MAKYLIEGGVKLKGTVKISGNKNSVLPCLAASLLTEEKLILKNIPKITDVEVFLQILKILGVDSSHTDHTISLEGKGLKTHILPKELVGKLRASILLVGPLLSRSGLVEFSHPGGDVVGKRSIETHMEGFKNLGFKFKNADRDYRGRQSHQVKEDKEIFLDEPSVTATENMILASVMGDRTVTVKHCAMEPHVVDLCKLLSLMGAKIEGVGTQTLIIKGVEKLKGAEFSIGSDYIEMGTYAVASAITEGEVQIQNCTLTDLEPILLPLQKMGVGIRTEDKNGRIIKVKRGQLKSLPKLSTNVWPGFPTDLMSAMIVLATQAKGVTLCHDWMYESRMFFVDKLISMGAHITIADPHRVLVYGPTKLYGRELETPDIRAGMAMVLAALIAKGESVINRAELIERGYENVVEKLSSLGAKISKQL